MSNRDTSSTKDITKALFWGYSTIALSIWALASFLPLFGLFIPNQSYADLGIQALFLVTSFLSVFGGYMAVRLLKWQSVEPDDSTKPSKAGLLTAYASLWLIAYSLYIWFS
jgi:hypothetical protein